MIRKGVAFALSVGVLAVLYAAMLARGRSAAHAERQATTVGAVSGPIRDVTAQPFSQTPDPVAPQPVPGRTSEAMPGEAMQGLALVRPRFQRGGYGSKALLSFTLHNRNEFPVKDVAMRCEFASRDGRWTTARTRVLTDTLETQSRKRYGKTLIGFVGPSYGQARCAIVNASRADA
jgi:hypothetical protein